MRPSSAKAKGRRLQQWVRARILATFLDLQPDDVRSTSMGASGEDLLLSPAARARFPYAVECKNTERLNVWNAIAQAEANAAEGSTPLVVFTRNRAKTYAVLEFDHLLEVLCHASTHDS